MCSRIMNKEQITDIDFRQHPVDSKFVVILAQTAGNIIFMIAGRILLTHYGNVMIGPVHGWTHQISSTGIQSDILFIGMFNVDGFSNKRPIGSQHITAHLCKNFYVSHSCRHQDILKSLTYAFADNHNIIALLIGTIRDTDTAGQIDELNMRSCLFLQFHCDLEQYPCQFRIIIISHSIAGQKSVHSKMFNTLA